MRKSRPQKKINPDEVRILAELEDLLEKLGVELKYEKGGFKGGLCRVEDKEYFYLNKILTFEQKVSIITNQLRGMELEDVYLKPKIREMLEN
jgi:intein-encoded DNA endonuclease-like protein